MASTRFFLDLRSAGSDGTGILKIAIAHKKKFPYTSARQYVSQHNSLSIQKLSLALQITSINYLMSTETIDINIERINRLKVVLAEKNRKGKWLAEQLGKNEATVSRWCSNTAQPSLEMLVKIAYILNVETKDLLY